VFGDEDEGDVYGSNVEDDLGNRRMDESDYKRYWWCCC
jgi:hypothetical protein